MDINAILNERGNRYGPFDGHAEITQALKMVATGTVSIGTGEKIKTNWNRLDASKKEALEMIFHKVGRILNGDPNYLDNWVDISGYAQLAAETCKN
jgi:hypothetical protein